MNEIDALVASVGIGLALVAVAWLAAVIIAKFTDGDDWYT